jgi:hypothetical protein
MPFLKQILKATVQSGMGMTWHVGELPAFGFFRLPRGVPQRLLSEAYQSVKLLD